MCSTKNSHETRVLSACPYGGSLLLSKLRPVVTGVAQCGLLRITFSSVFLLIKLFFLKEKFGYVLRLFT